MTDLGKLHSSAGLPLNGRNGPMSDTPPDAATISEIVEMALSDHISFDLIHAQHRLGPTRSRR